MREAQTNFPELAKLVASSRQQIVVEVPDTPGLALVPADHLFALEETLEIISHPDRLDRIKTGEEALVAGNFVSQGQFEQEMGMATRTMPTRWRLFLSGPARRAVLGLAPEVSRPKVVEFLTGELLEQPASAGVELEGQLARRYVATISDQRLIYRLDPTNRAVRVIDVQSDERVFVGR